MKVLDKGELSLIDSMGGDKSVVRAARVSNGVFDETTSIEKDTKLINYLTKHRHGTPFEHATFTFYVKTPLFVRSEWHRHRMGSFNEISGRYVRFDPEFYIPSKFRIPATTNKQGSQEPELSEDVRNWNDLNRGIIGAAVTEAYSHYTALLSQGVAKEMARMVLPLNLYTQFYWTVNARSLMNFLSLRTGEDAQAEIREYATRVEEFFAQMMPITWEAWNLNGRIAP